MINKKTRPYKHPQINLRIPEELKGKIQKIADENRRSMNAEIINMLKDAIDDIELFESLEANSFSGESTSDISKKNASEEINYEEQPNIIQPEMIYTFTSSELINLINTEVDKIKAGFFVAAQRYNSKDKK